MKKVPSFLLALFPFVCLLSLFPFLAGSAEANPIVVINEIAWMGTPASPNEEWIELFNDSSLPVDLRGWKISSPQEKINIALRGAISPRGFFLLKRRGSTSFLRGADLVYRGRLRNKGERLFLFDEKGRIRDEVDCAGGWFAGDNKSKQTMERRSPPGKGSLAVNWQNSAEPGGTPGGENSRGEGPAAFRKAPARISLTLDGANPLPLFLLSLFIAILSGGAVLFLRKKTYNKKN